MKDYEGFNIENYQEEENAFSSISANIFSLILSVVIIAVFCLIYYKIWGYFINLSSVNIKIIPCIILLVGSIFVHEMIHGMVWSKYTETKISVILKLIIRLCHCKNVIKIKNYIIGLIMPNIILGIIPTLSGIIMGNIFIFIFGLIMIVTGTDDFYVIWLLRKRDKNNLMKDIDNKIGFITYKPK